MEYNREWKHRVYQYISWGVRCSGRDEIVGPTRTDINYGCFILCNKTTAYGHGDRVKYHYVWQILLHMANTTRISSQEVGQLGNLWFIIPNFGLCTCRPMADIIYVHWIPAGPCTQITPGTEYGLSDGNPELITGLWFWGMAGDSITINATVSYNWPSRMDENLPSRCTEMSRVFLASVHSKQLWATRCCSGRSVRSRFWLIAQIANTSHSHLWTILPFRGTIFFRPGWNIWSRWTWLSESDIIN